MRRRSPRAATRGEGRRVAIGRTRAVRARTGGGLSPTFRGTTATPATTKVGTPRLNLLSELRLPPRSWDRVVLRLSNNQLFLQFLDTS